MHLCIERLTVSSSVYTSQAACACTAQKLTRSESTVSSFVLSACPAFFVAALPSFRYSPATSLAHIAHQRAGKMAS